MVGSVEVQKDPSKAFAIYFRLYEQTGHVIVWLYRNLGDTSSSLPVSFNLCGFHPVLFLEYRAKKPTAGLFA